MRSRFRFVRIYPSQDHFTQERYNQLLKIAFTTLTPHISDEFIKFLDMAYDYRISVRTCASLVRVGSTIRVTKLITCTRIKIHLSIKCRHFRRNNFFC